MRRIAAVGGFVVLVCAVATLVAVVWVNRALAAAIENPSPLCQTTEDRHRIVSGDFPLGRQDTLVVKAINFDQGVPRMAWWHLRGAAIHLTYVTFWSPSRRVAEFHGLALRMKDCPPQQGRG